MPLPFLTHFIAAGESLDVPVMTIGYYFSNFVYSLKEVVLRATLDGPPGSVVDEVLLSP